MTSPSTIYSSGAQLPLSAPAPRVPSTAVIAACSLVLADWVKNFHRRAIFFILSRNRLLKRWLISKSEPANG